MDDELAAKWFEEGERLSDMEEEALDVEDVPNLKPRLPLVFAGIALLAVFSLIFVCVS